MKRSQGITLEKRGGGPVELESGHLRFEKLMCGIVNFFL